MAASLEPRAFRRPGRLVPAGARGLRSRSVRLAPGRVMDWHSTRDREELLIVLAGQVVLEARLGRSRRVTLKAGQSLFLPARTEHRVLNRSSRPGQYIYITAPARSGHRG